MSYRWTIALSLGALAAFGLLPATGLASSSGKGSETIRNVGCPMLDGFGNLFQATGTIRVSADGSKASLTCRARDVPTPGGAAIYYDYANTGQGCQVIGLVTNDWSETISTRGVANKSCYLLVP